MPNIILVYQPAKMAMSDYRTIAAAIAKKRPEITTFIVDTKELNWADAEQAAQAPTLTVSPLPIKKFKPPRGPIFEGYEWPKSQQYAWLRESGVAVPDWIEITPDLKLDPEEWGPYVVIKPDLGRRGAEIYIKRTGRVRYKPRTIISRHHPGSMGAMLAQRFIYTGRWAVNYRVVTLFSRALFCWRCEIDHSFPPLNSRYDFRDGGGISIVSNKRSSRYTLAYDKDVIALAERVHDVFPKQPLLGSDIVRDADSGELYVLEASPRGDAWLMSSDTGLEIQDAN
ncbi:MAG: hypothetical protein ACE5FM_04105, partial [Methyloligellaceae bacterium]